MEAISEQFETKRFPVRSLRTENYRPNVPLFFVLLALLALPTFLYWNTTWLHYGLRDDYSVTRESREEYGKEVRFCGSQARPIYGWLLQSTFKHIDHIRDLSWARLGGSVCLGLISAGACAILVLMFGWSLVTAACLGALLALVPTGQVIASWSILWPYAFSALLAMSAFATAEHSFRQPVDSRAKRLMLTSIASVLVISSTWVFQPNALFYLVFVAAAVVRRGEWIKQSSRIRLFQHLLLLGGALVVAYLLIRLFFATGLLPISKRIAFEADLPGKLLWFARNALPNALAMLVLNDFQGRTAPYYQIAVVSTTLLIITGGILVGKRHGWRQAAFWFGALLVLVVGSYSINIVAAERWPSYRTIYPLVGVVLVFMAASMEVLGEAIPSLKRFRHGLGLMLVVAAAILARRQAYELIAVPQNKEYRLVEQESKKLDLTRDQKVYVITPTPSIAPARLLYSDEFGSLSIDSDWVPKEILKLIFYENYPTQPRCTSLDHMVSGEKPPPPGLYDVVIDLRGLREMPE
jgi:hypothetical protein